MNEVATPTTLAERIEQAVEKEEIQLPPLPELAIKLRELLADEDHADARAVAELVQNEPAVVATLLRCANSAAFGGLRPISDLGQAIARLGLKRVGSLVTAMQVKGQFQADTPEKKQWLQTMWDHSVATALAASKLARRAGDDAEEAFLAGLLHDCGRLLVVIGVDHVQGHDPSVEVTPAVLEDLMVALHAKLGHHTLSAWRLPEPMCEAALRHEDEPQPGDPPLLTAVQAGDAIARKLGCHPEPDTELDLLQEPAIEVLGVPDLELAALMVDLEDELAEVRKLFG